MDFTSKDGEQIVKIIEEYDSIVIFGHAYPDGDCYGSQIALREMIRDTHPNKKVYACGSGLPALFKLISPMDEVSDDVIANSLAIMVDVCDLDRVEDQRILTAKKIIAIDHHIRTEPVSFPNFINPHAVATAEILTRFFLFTNKYKISKVASAALYTGLVTDSGRFLYPPTSEETFLIAAALVKNGIDINAIYHQIYATDEKLLRLKAYILSNYKKTSNGVIYAKIPYRVCQSLKLNPHTVANNVNIFANIKDLNIWVMIAEDKNGKYSVELRSAKVPVRDVAFKYGGGGHNLASGALLNKSSDIKSMIKDLDELLRKDKENV